jgi:hypothetical protein
MKRRNFIALGAASTLVIPAGYYYHKKSQRVINQINFPATLALFCDNAEFKKIGTDYLQLHPQENNADKLKEILLAQMEEKKITIDTVAAHLNKTIENDFATKNTLLVRQWILSQTEARQCALFSLTYK